MLNVKINDSIETNLPIEEAYNLCRKVAVDIGWRVLEESQVSLTIKEKAVSGTSFNWPAEVEMILSSIDTDKTVINLRGSIFGGGPVQKGHLQGQLGNIKNRIEVAINEIAKAKQKDSSNAKVSIAEELEKLASLRNSGILTDEEFNEAKKKLLDNI